MTPDRLELSVVVPVFNEQDNVEILFNEIAEVLRGVSVRWELIFVDDGSTDATFARLRALRGADPRVRVIRFRRNFGQTPAMQAGFDAASGDVVVTMDGDLQNDPRDIPRLLDGIRAGHDFVIGWRKDRKDKLFTRKIPSWLANRLIARITKIPIHDNGCSLKAYRREVVQRTQLYGEMHRFIPAMMSLSGCTFREIVVHHRARRFGSSKYGLSRTLKVLSDLLLVKVLTGFTTRPALWFGLTSVPFFVLSALFLARSAYDYAVAPLEETVSIVFPTTALLFAAAFANLLLLGMVAELVVWSGDYRESESILPAADVMEKLN